MSPTAPHQATPLDPDDLARLRAVLVDAVEVNERQEDNIPAGPEADAHRVARRSLEEALARLDSGTYGVCTGCGDALPVERLELVPDAELCMTCVHRPHALYA